MLEPANEWSCLCVSFVKLLILLDEQWKPERGDKEEGVSPRSGLEPAAGLGSVQAFCYVIWSRGSSSSSAVCPVMSFSKGNKKSPKVTNEINPNMDLAHIQKHRLCLCLGFWKHLSLDSSFPGCNDSESKNCRRVLAREIEKATQILGIGVGRSWVSICPPGPGIREQGACLAMERMGKVVSVKAVKERSSSNRGRNMRGVGEGVWSVF